jgi:hypothetical protein
MFTSVNYSRNVVVAPSPTIESLLFSGGRLLHLAYGLIAISLLAAAQSSLYAITPVTEVVAKTGDLVPHGDTTFGSVNAFTAPVLNNHGLAAFRAFLNNGKYGLFLGSGNHLRERLRTGDPAPGGVFYTLDAPALNDPGELLSISKPVSNTNLYDLVRSEPDSGVFSRLLAAGQPAPGGGNVSIPNIGQPPAFNQSGQAAFVANILNSGTNSAIYRTGANGSLVQIARLNQAVPGGNGQFGAFHTQRAIHLVLNEAGQVAFEAPLFNTSGGSVDNSGLYRGDGTTLVEIARAGQSPLPGGGTLLNFLGDTSPDLNDSGEVVFLSFNDYGGFDKFTIFKGSGGALTEIARSGETIPNSTDLFRFFDGYARINNAGQVAFIADITPVPSGGHIDSAIFRADGFAGHGIVVARAGQQTPNGIGIFSSLGANSFCLNNSGQIAFTAGLDIDLSNITPIEEHGIFFFDGTVLHQVAREHDPLLGSTISSLRLAGTMQTPSGGVAQAERSGLNDLGQIAFGFTLADGREGIAIWSSNPKGQLINISTRGSVQTGGNVMIGGLIITGTGPKTVLFRALGPTLAQPPFNVPGVLADPVLELHDASGAIIASNDNWQQAANASSIPTNRRPPNSAESAILIDLNPGRYTAIVRGVNNTTGNALVEAYDLDISGDSKLSNISTRGLVQTGAGVMIVGVIVQGPENANVVIRALGPTLGQPPISLPGALPDPILELRNAIGTLITSNDNWQDSQKPQIQALAFAPPNATESVIVAPLVPANYTAVVRGKNNTTGIALVEVYQSE